jgi:hypothetical protein
MESEMTVEGHGGIVYSINDDKTAADLGSCPHDAFQRAEQQLLSQTLAAQALVKREPRQQDGRNAVRLTTS